MRWPPWRRTTQPPPSRRPLPEALDAWEARQQAEAAKLTADERYREAREIADDLRRKRADNHFADMLRDALGGPS